MYNEGFEQFFKLGKHISTPVEEWNKAAAGILHKVAEQNMEILNDNFSRFSDQMKRLSNVKRPEDLITLQKDCINEDISSVIENSQKIVHMSMENIEEITKLCGTVRESVLTPVVNKMEKHAKDFEKTGK